MAAELDRAIRSQNIPKINEVLDKTPKLVKTKIGSDSELPIFRAVFTENPKVVEVLLDRGADVNVVDDQRPNWTPLIHAVHEFDPPMIELLLKRGADPTLKSGGGKSPMQYFAEQFGGKDLAQYAPAKYHANAKQILDLLISHGAGPTLFVKHHSSGKTPLDFLPSDLEEYAIKAAEEASGFKTRTLPSLATLSVASAKPGSKIPPLPHEVVGQVIRPFLDPQGKPTKKLFPTYSEATKSGIVQRAAEQEDQEALAAMKTGGRRKTRMRKTKKRRTLRKHKWRTG